MVITIDTYGSSFDPYGPIIDHHDGEFPLFGVSDTTIVRDFEVCEFT